MASETSPPTRFATRSNTFMLALSVAIAVLILGHIGLIVMLVGQFRSELAAPPAPFNDIYTHTDLQSEISTVETRLPAPLDNSPTVMDANFRRIDDRFERTDTRLEPLYGRFERLDERFERIDERFKWLDDRFKRLESRMRRREQRAAYAEGFFSAALPAAGIPVPGFFSNPGAYSTQ